MVKVLSKGRYYEYPNKVVEGCLIDKKIKEDFNQFVKDRKISKSKLLEEFYKTILVRFRDGSLNSSEGYVTINILRSPICKRQ